MKNAIIIHGMPSKEEYCSPAFPSPSNFQWIPWLKKELIANGVNAETPEMPHPYAPDYEAWKSEFERHHITPETILVGHSCGAGFLLRWLSESKDVRVSGVFLVAPWLDPFGELETRFFNFEIDPKIASRTQRVVVCNSTDDSEDVQVSVQKVREAVHSIEYIEFQDKGHFVGEEFIKNGFPELLDKILKQ